MKLGKFAVLNLLCFAMLPATAQTYGNDDQSGQGNSNSQNNTNLVNYLKNWGSYLGYDITNPPSPAPVPEDMTNSSQAETSLFNTFFGSIPVVTPPNSGNSSANNSSGNAGAPFVPTTVTNASQINAQSNQTFKNFTSVSQQDAVTANALTDQLPFQSDPVTQAVFNILGTPDVSYCLNSTTGVVSNPTNPNAVNGTSTQCSALGATMFQNQIVENVVGTLPSASQYYTYTQNANLLPQLNSNALIAPLSYTTDSQNQNTSKNQGVPGLTSQNQIQQASNFIRYVSGSVIPTILPSQSAYQALYSQATDNNGGLTQAQAQAKLSSYLTMLRVYAAQTSVGMGNLYYILSRRIPQQSNTGNQNPTSQALNEYNMATWRIQPTTSNGNQTQSQWLTNISNSSPATVEKEIAILLSEINYQLYLDRQIQERILMTQSVSLLQGTKAGQPSSDLSNQTINATSTSPTQNTQ
jgi:intracellular multiplication protein IcmX